MGICRLVKNNRGFCLERLYSTHNKYKSSSVVPVPGFYCLLRTMIEFLYYTLAKYYVLL